MAPCNCGQSRKPTGWGQVNKPSAETKPAATPATPSQPQAQSVTASGAQTFSLRTSAGVVYTFGSRLERDAALVRYGAGASVS